jgi:lysozyme
MSKAKVASLAVVLAAAPFVAVYEGVVLTTYQDPVGIPTACVGETDGGVVDMKARFSRDECMAVLGASLYRHAVELDKCIKVQLKQHEAASLLSVAYNVGVAKACGSTLVKRVNAGDLPAACAELDKWVYAKGIKLRGLIKRRAAERAMCEGRA